MKYLLHRMAGAVCQLVVLSAAAFLALDLVPGDFSTSAAFELQSSRAVTAAWRAQHGLDRSWPRRYVTWIGSALKGDFGKSYAYEVPVASLLRPRLGKTMQIAVPAFLMSWAAGLLLALMAATRGQRCITLVEFGAFVASMFPDVVGVSLLLWLAVWTGVVSITGAMLPVVCLICPLLPSVVIHSAKGLSNARASRFVLLAERRGVTGTQLWRRYVVPAAANPLITLVGLSLASVLGSSLLVEVVLGWPGIGPLFLDAVRTQDSPVIVTVVVLLGAVLIVSNFAADMALYWLDPRIRVEHSRAS